MYKDFHCKDRMDCLIFFNVDLHNGKIASLYWDGFLIFSMKKKKKFVMKKLKLEKN